jgi:hypothetical protein
VLIVFFTLKTRLAIGAVASSAPNRSSNAKESNLLKGTKRRLFQIAMQTCLCLILNLIATVGVSASLRDWGVSSDLWLQCQLFETWNARDWDAYGFSDG